MRAVDQCSPCILHDVEGALELLSARTRTKEKILEQSRTFLEREFHKRRVPSFYITGVHRILKKESGIAYPFSDLRDRCNAFGMVLADSVEKKALMLKGVKRFDYLIRWAIAGNHFDFRTIAAGYTLNVYTVDRILKKIALERLRVAHVRDILQAVKKSRHILFIHDNVGEIALDAILIRELLHWCPTVVSALRGGPITSDATMKDGITVGLDRIASRIICAGPDTLGISWEEMSQNMKIELHTSDLIISKGQANYYVLSEHRDHIRPPVVFLFRTKCSPVSESFGFQGKGNVAALWRSVRKNRVSGRIRREEILRTSEIDSGTSPKVRTGRFHKKSQGLFQEFERP